MKAFFVVLLTLLVLGAIGSAIGRHGSDSTTPTDTGGITDYDRQVQQYSCNYDKSFPALTPQWVDHTGTLHHC